LVGFFCGFGFFWSSQTYEFNRLHTKKNKNSSVILTLIKCYQLFFLRNRKNNYNKLHFSFLQIKKEAVIGDLQPLYFFNTRE